MKKTTACILTIALIVLAAQNSFCQSDTIKKNYLVVKPGIFFNMAKTHGFEYLLCEAYIAPAIKLNRHELYAGICYPINKPDYPNSDVQHNFGMVFGYQYTVFRLHRADLFLEYSFQYGSYSFESVLGSSAMHWPATATDYIFNHIINFGLSGYFDKKRNAGFSLTTGGIGFSTHYFTTVAGNQNENKVEYGFSFYNTSFSLNFKIVDMNRKRNNNNH